MTKDKIVTKTKKGKLVQRIYISGPDLGDYYYVRTDNRGQFVSKHSSREITEVNKIIEELNSK
jgi:hypothetical protein